MNFIRKNYRVSRKKTASSTGKGSRFPPPKTKRKIKSPRAKNAPTGKSARKTPKLKKIIEYNEMNYDYLYKDISDNLEENIISSTKNGQQLRSYSPQALRSLINIKKSISLFSIWSAWPTTRCSTTL